MNTEVKEVAEQKVENKKATKKILAFLIGAAVIGGGYAAYWELHGSKFEETENAYVSGLQNAVSSQIAGNITQVSIQDTQSVKKGDLAVKIDDTDYKLALERAENDLAHAVRGVRSLQLNTIQTQDTIGLRKIELAKALSDEQRDKLAYKAGIISREQLDNTEQKLDLATKNKEIAQNNYQNSIIQSVSKNIQSHPDVAKAIIQYKQSYIDLERTNIRLSNDGIIAKKSVYIGQRVSPNQTLFNVIDLNGEWVDANFKESQLKSIKVGQPVELYSDVNEKSYEGYVAAIGAGSGSALSLLPAQNATGNWIKIVQRVPVRINIDVSSLRKNGTLPIGTSIKATIKLNEGNNTVIAPTQKIEINYDEAKLNKAIESIITQNMKAGK